MKASAKFILAATAFNLLSEYAFRGFGRIVTDPIQIIYLFIVYFAYFHVIKDLILRYKLNDYGLFPIGVITVSVFQLLFPQGGAFIPPFFLGVNPALVFYVNLVMWYPIQTLLGLYFSRRIAGDGFLTEQPSPVRNTIKYALIFIISTSLTNFFTPRIGQINPLGILTFAVLIGVSLYFLKKQIKKGSTGTQLAMPIARFYDAITIFLLVYFLATAVIFSGSTQMYHAHPLTPGAVKYNIKALVIVAFIFYVYWGATKKLIVRN